MGLATSLHFFLSCDSFISVTDKNKNDNIEYDDNKNDDVEYDDDDDEENDDDKNDDDDDEENDEDKTTMTTTTITRAMA